MNNYFLLSLLVISSVATETRCAEAAGQAAVQTAFAKFLVQAQAQVCRAPKPLIAAGVTAVGLRAASWITSSWKTCCVLAAGAVGLAWYQWGTEYGLYPMRLKYVGGAALAAWRGAPMLEASVLAQHKKDGNKQVYAMYQQLLANQQQAYKDIISGHAVNPRALFGQGSTPPVDAEGAAAIPAALPDMQPLASAVSTAALPIAQPLPLAKFVAGELGLASAGQRSAAAVASYAANAHSSSSMSDGAAASALDGLASHAVSALNGQALQTPPPSAPSALYLAPGATHTDQILGRGDAHVARALEFSFGN